MEEQSSFMCESLSTGLHCIYQSSCRSFYLRRKVIKEEEEEEEEEGLLSISERQRWDTF